MAARFVRGVLVRARSLFGADEIVAGSGGGAQEFVELQEHRS